MPSTAEAFDVQHGHFTITPFDPTAGIRFKYGRMYGDRVREVAEFQRTTGFSLPSDFLELIGDYCEGGFDGHYRVRFDNRVEVQWHHLLLMKIADDIDNPRWDTARLIGAKAKLFLTGERLSYFPFGEALAVSRPAAGVGGYLSFDLRRSNAVVFVPAGAGRKIDVAPSFRDMVLHSQFVFHG